MSQTRAFKQGAEPNPFNGDVAERGEGDDGKDKSKDRVGAEHSSLTLSLSEEEEETHLGLHAHPMTNPTTKANHPAISPKIKLTSKAIAFQYKKPKGYLKKIKKICWINIKRKKNHERGGERKG